MGTIQCVSLRELGAVLNVLNHRSLQTGGRGHLRPDSGVPQGR